MDWPTVAVVLGSNVAIAITTIVSTRWYLSCAERLSKREAKREPLLKLRSELARMASKQERLVEAAHNQEPDKIIQPLVDDWRSFLGGEWRQTLFMLDDLDLIKRVEEILNDYNQSSFVGALQAYFDAGRLEEAMNVTERNKIRIAGIQSLINKRLEKL